MIVIGGGPAGAAAAIVCAAARLRVALITRPRSTEFVPGETLHPGIEPLLERLGIAECLRGTDFLRDEGHWVTWNGPRTLVRFGADADGAWRGFHAWRPRFDALLLQRARDAGVAVREGEAVQRVLHRGARVYGVETVNEALEASITIDASGARQVVARQLDLRVQYASRPLIAWYGWARSTHRYTRPLPELVADADGWTWTAQVRPGIHQWTRLRLDDWRPAPTWVPPQLAEAEPCGPVRGADVTWRLVTPSAGVGYFLTGDAALVLDPTSSHGVLRAIMSGMMAAQLAMARLIHRRSQAEVARTYASWLTSWFRHDVDRMAAAYDAAGLSVACAGTGARMPEEEKTGDPAAVLEA